MEQKESGIDVKSPKIRHITLRRKRRNSLKEAIDFFEGHASPPGHFLQTPTTFPPTPPDVSLELPRCFLRTPTKFPANSHEVSPKLPRRFLRTRMIFSPNSHDVFPELPTHLPVLRPMFPRSTPPVSRISNPSCQPPNLARQPRKPGTPAQVTWHADSVNFGNRSPWPRNRVG